jgi:hypothetical protein
MTRFLWAIFVIVAMLGACMPVVSWAQTGDPPVDPLEPGQQAPPPPPGSTSTTNELGITITTYPDGTIVRTDMSNNILPSPRQCIFGGESSGDYGVCNEWNFCGPNQMDVSAMMSVGFCVQPVGAALTAMFPGCPETSYWGCNKWRNENNGLDDIYVHWDECVWTAAAQAAAQAAGGPPLYQGTAAQNMAQFTSNPGFQDAAFNTYMDNAEAYANTLYNQFYGNGQDNIINGIPMTPEIIQYLINAAGNGGAYNYISSGGTIVAQDSALNYNLHDTARKMFNCLMGLGDCA